MAKKLTNKAQPRRAKKSKKTLNDFLEEITVANSDQYHVDVNGGKAPLDWFYVADDTGVIAYFVKEDDAFRFRLAEINRRLNP